MSITPISTHKTDLTYQTQLKNQAESLLKLFKYFLNDPQQLLSFSLVNKFWRHLALHPHLWQKICYQTGIEIPLNQDLSYEASYHAFCYEKSPLFLNQVRNCIEPKIEPREIKVDLKKCSIHFVQDRFLTMRKKGDVIVYNIENQEIVNKISVGLKIFCLCTTQEMIFLSLRNRQIVAYPLIETARIPILTLDGHEEENIMDWKSDPILLYANDQWLVSLSSKVIKQWDIATKRCVATQSLSCFYDLQIRQNRLFMRTYNSGDGQQNPLNLLIADLNQCNLNFTQYRTIPNTNISIEEKSVSYIETVFAEPFEDSDEEATELIEDQTRLQTFFFHSSACDFKLIDPEQANELSYLMTQNGLAVIVRHHDKKKQKPEMIELFDIKAGATLHRIHEHKMCAFGNNWPIKIFQGTILYMTEENLIVKITFPQAEKVDRSKRKLNSSSDGLLAKKMKTMDNSSKG